jgi:UDP-N-acetylmuramoyl-tripeptide--D-alanyl-D-alanine ligase
MEYINIITIILLTMILGWYLITNLQWYNYQIQRVVTKHHKKQWHLFYFIVPFTLYYFLDNAYFQIYFYIIHLPAFLYWYMKLDRKLVFTMRVKRFLAILLFITLAVLVLCLSSQSCEKAGVLIPLLFTYAITTALELIFLQRFKAQAKEKLKARKDLKVIAITASFGKTSIKNYLHQVLSEKFKTYMTPRSVNTINGLIKDVNVDLPNNIDIYIAEAGARKVGDIATISKFLEPQYAIIGSVGEQHIEYFKTLDNIIYTKMELLESPRLAHGFVHDSVPILDYDTITKFPNNLKVLKSDLDGIEFSIDIEEKTEIFKAPILGSFNAINLCAVILMAHKLGMSIDQIKEAFYSLKAVDHRLQKIEAGGKIILDDSFNGNLEGMLEAVQISSTHKGRKVIITPGLVESTDEANTTFAKAVDETFDIVILTGSLNIDILSQNISNDKIIILKDKANMEDILSEHTQAGDLILFANDAPNFI